jgi:hypothetical protein
MQTIALFCSCFCVQLDEASRALLMKVLEDATQDAVRRQAKVTYFFSSGEMTTPTKIKICLSAYVIRFSSVPSARERALHAIRLPDRACRSAPEAIRTHVTLNFYSKRNILSWSARFSTLFNNSPRSQLLYISTLYQLPYIILYFSHTIHSSTLPHCHCARPTPPNRTTVRCMEWTPQMRFLSPTLTLAYGVRCMAAVFFYCTTNWILVAHCLQYMAADSLRPVASPSPRPASWPMSDRASLGFVRFYRIASGIVPAN